MNTTKHETHNAGSWRWLWRLVRRFQQEKEEVRVWVKSAHASPYEESYFFVNRFTGRRDAEVILYRGAWTVYVRGGSYGDFGEKDQAMAQAEKYSRSLPN